MAHDHIKQDLYDHHETNRLSLQLVLALIGGVMLLCSVAAEFLFDHEFYPALLGMASALLLGGPLAMAAIKELSHGHMHMNELVALAVLAAFAIGKYQEAAAIAFFMIISVLIENRTALGAASSIESLIRITPTRAHLLIDGKETLVNAHDLKPGDRVRVLPGDALPADGRVVSGTSTVNQANITGESLPVDKAVGHDVFGGTMNLTGALEIEVTKAGQDTTLGRVKNLILQAERTRIPILRLVDQYASWYTPTVLMLVGIVLFLTLRAGLANPWERAIAMLVVACPCALVLATPTAMVAGLSSAARLGVLVKSVVDLEAARNLTAIIFDKTGTLTTGKLQVTRLSPHENADPAQLLRVAAAAAHNSRHPVAQAVVEVAQKARVRPAPPTDFREIPGQGIRATVDGKPVWMGRASWLSSPDSEARLDPALVSTLQSMQTDPKVEGLSLLFVVQDRRLLGWIGLEDNARPEAPTAMDALKALGLKRLVIVTGDRQSVAKRVAAQMHTEYKAEVLPAQKLEMVHELKDAGHHVAVVGDGVNDAPALAAGDISIAMGAAGSDVAIHSASIALMNNNLNRIPFLIELSRKTVAVVKQNLVFGVGFILVTLTLSAANYVTPIVAAILHTVSSLVVIFNSARLVRVGEDIEFAEAQRAAASPARSPHTPQPSPEIPAPPELAWSPAT